MKSRKNTINGKVIVTGDVNELQPNEILINEQLQEDGTIQLDIKEIGEDGSVKELTSGDKESNDSWGTFFISNLGGTYKYILLEEHHSAVINTLNPVNTSFSKNFNICDNVSSNIFFKRNDKVVDLDIWNYGKGTVLFKITPEIDKEIKIQFLYDDSYEGDVPENWDGENIISNSTSLHIVPADAHIESVKAVNILDVSGKLLLNVNFKR